MPVDDVQDVLPQFLDHANAAVAIKDLDGRYRFANAEFLRYAASGHASVLGLGDADVLAPYRLAQLAAAEQAAIAGRTAVRCSERVLRAGAAAVSYLSTRFPVFDDQPQLIALGIVAIETTGQFDDTGEAERALRAAEQINRQLRAAIGALEELASTDRLTQAWNRRRLDEVIDSEMHRSNRYAHPISLMLIDIDHFKRVNDTWGHQAGDRVLAGVAQCIRGVVRKADSLTRWGGEEFIVLMPNTGLAPARALAGRILDAIAAQDFSGPGRVTVSIGVAEYVPGTTAETWIGRADRAMYRAKHDGRNRVAVDAGRSRASAVEHVEGAFVQLVWKEAFGSGHELIDQQHRELFAVANTLLGAVLAGRPADEIAVIVGQLLHDVSRHFRDEEAILRQLAFSGVDRHCAEHASLLARGAEVARDFAAGALSLGSLFQFLAHDVITVGSPGTELEFAL